VEASPSLGRSINRFAHAGKTWNPVISHLLPMTPMGTGFVQTTYVKTTFAHLSQPAHFTSAFARRKYLDFCNRRNPEKFCWTKVAEESSGTLRSVKCYPEDYPTPGGGRSACG
jgi:hypothetical protein